MNENNTINILKDGVEYDAPLEKIYKNRFGPGRFAKAANLLRENNKCHYDISFVALENNELIGGCRMWPIISQNNQKAVFLGPIAVTSDVQSKGLGSKLVKECLKANDEKNSAIIILVGDLSFFAQFGFVQVPPKHIILPMPADEKRILWRLNGHDKDEFSGKVFVPQ